MLRLFKIIYKRIKYRKQLRRGYKFIDTLGKQVNITEYIQLVRNKND